ncbi:MAG: hypothetical protein EHM48_02710 [Planctomycetaceae bacterium]|nr:MAG: hypothetical protein EHM48_02710 [Planctomycetaceae bacterium]
MAFLVVPVKAISRRPITRRSLIWPVLAAVVLLTIMVVAACFAVMQTIDETKGWGLRESDKSTFLMIGIAWFVWAVAMLIWYARKQKEPLGYMQRLIRFLLAGSILELVIAVPAHVLSRWRNECCAGMGTFWGLAAGISVALFAFGPAALIYFAKRYSSLRPNIKGDSADTGTATNDAAVAPTESAAESPAENPRP